jgi:inner membrane protein
MHVARWRRDLLIADGKTVTLFPAEVAQDFSFGGDDNQHGKLALFGAKVEGLAKPNAQFNVASTLRFSGAQRIAVLAYGKTTHVVVAGDWASPGFDGGFLPIGRSIAGNGFTAEWSVPFIARGRALRRAGPTQWPGSMVRSSASRLLKWRIRTNR